MFKLFRRHQKVLLTGVALLAIGSMVFSAIAPLFLKDQAQVESKKNLINDPKQALVHLFNRSFDAEAKDIVFPEHLFTEMVLKSELYKKVYEAHSELIDQHLNDIFIKLEHYQSPEVIKGSTYHQLAAQISPKMGPLLEQIKAGGSLDSIKKLELICIFFQEKIKMPAPLMYQYLKTISKNQVLVHPDELCFFGLKTPTDFFGPTLVNQSAAYLLKILKQESKQEKPQLVMQKFSEKLNDFYQVNLHPNQFFIACGLTPEVGLELLQYSEAFKNFKQKIQEQILVDSLTHLSFSEFTEKKIPVLMYSFDLDLVPKTLEEAYCLDLFARVKDPLIFDQYELKMRSLDKSQALQKLPKKQQYAQALSSYQELSVLMPYELSKDLTTEKQKLEALKSLKGSSKECLDSYIQKVFVEQDPAFFQKILLEAPVKNQTLCLSRNFQQSPLSGFKTCEELKEKLDILPINTPVIFDTGGAFVYEIELLSKHPEQSIKHYQEAVSNGLLKVALKNELDSFYKDTIKKSPSKFLNKERKIKGLDECYLEVLELKATALKMKLASVLGVDPKVSSALLVKAYPKMILTESLEDKSLATDFRIKTEAKYVRCREHNHPSFLKLFVPGTALRSEVMETKEGYCIYEKTGPEEVGPLLMDKAAIELLAEERFKLMFNQRFADLRADV